MKVAVIGANGFIGSRVIESFHLGDGPTVVAVAREPSRLRLAARFALDLRIADALDPASLTRALSGCGAVVHAVRVDSFHAKRLPVVLCRSAAEAGVRRVIYLSSAAVHGPNPPPDTDEKSPLRPDHASESYNALIVAERQFFTECRRLGLAGYALRPGVVFGPRSRLIADVVTELRSERAWLLQGGTGICNSLYVDNLVAAIRQCLRAKTGAGLPYLLSDGEAVTWRDFYHTLGRELDLPVDRIRFLDSLPDGGAAGQPSPTWPPGLTVSADRAALQCCTWRLPTAAAARQFGYNPAVPFDEAIRRTAAWWRYAQGEFPAAA